MNGWTFRRPWWLTRRHKTTAIEVPSGPSTQTLTPLVAVAVFTALTPAVQPGPVTVTPSVATAAWTVNTPSVSTTVTVTPSVAVASWTALDPAAIAVFTPEVAVATWTALDPAVQPGPVTLTPSVATASWTALDPAVTGTVTVTPSVAVATWTALDPSASESFPTGPESFHRRRQPLGEREFEIEQPVRRARQRPYYSSFDQTLTPAVAVRTWVVSTPDVSETSVPQYTRRRPKLLAADDAETLRHERHRLFRPTADTGPQELTPEVAIATWAALDPAVQPGPVTLTPSVAVGTWAVPDPTVTTTVTVTPSVAVATWATPTPDVSATVTLTPSVATATWAALDPTVTTTVTLTPDVAVSTWAVPTPTADNPPPPHLVQRRRAPQGDRVDEVERPVNRARRQPYFIGNDQTLTPSVAVATWTALTPAVEPGAVTLTPEVAVATWGVPTPTVSDGTVPAVTSVIAKGEGGGRDVLPLRVGHKDLRTHTYRFVGRGGLRVHGTAEVHFRAGSFDELPRVQPLDSLVPEIPPPPVEQPRVEPTPPPAAPAPPEPQPTLRHLPRTWRVHGTGSLPALSGTATFAGLTVTSLNRVEMPPQRQVDMGPTPEELAAQSRLAAILADDEDAIQLLIELDLI